MSDFDGAYDFHMCVEDNDMFLGVTFPIKRHQKGKLKIFKDTVFQREVNDLQLLFPLIIRLQVVVVVE